MEGTLHARTYGNVLFWKWLVAETGLRIGYLADRRSPRSCDLQLCNQLHMANPITGLSVSVLTWVMNPVHIPPSAVFAAPEERGMDN